MPRAPRRSNSAVTMQDVARRAGVSTMSVSNVLNGRKVTPETRAAVLQAVEALQYTPNPAARQLASASAISVGLLHGNVEHAFFSAILVGALNAASRLGVQLLLQQVDFNDLDAGWDAVAALRGRGAKAILLPPVFCEAMSRSPQRAQMDLPMIGVAPGEAPARIACVRIDEFAAARELTGLLLAKGHRRIGFVGAPAGLSFSDSRRDGYLAGLRAHGVEADPRRVADGGLTFASALAAAGRLLALPEPPTAIFAVNDDMAAAALTAAHMRGLRVPQDLAVAGFDDSALAIKVWPPLTTVRQPIAAMTEAALEILVRQVRDGVDPRTAAATATYLDYVIVRRASTGD